MIRIIYMLFFLPTLLIGQSNYYGSKRIKSITTKNAEQKGNVYLMSELIDSIGKVNVYLMNRSNSNVEFENYEIRFEVEARNKNGKWQTLASNEPIGFVCGTPSEIYELPPNTYTWQSSLNHEYDGAFQTEIRFLHQLNDSLIYSKPLSLKINPDLFYAPWTYRINVLNKIAEQSPEKLKENILLIAKTYFRKNEFTKSIETLKNLILEHPNYYEAIYIQARSLCTIIIKDPESSIIDKCAIISTASEAMEKIPIHSNRYDDAQKFIRIYNEFLPEQGDADLFPIKICEQTNKEYHIWLRRKYIEEKIKIRYRTGK